MPMLPEYNTEMEEEELEVAETEEEEDRTPSPPQPTISTAVRQGTNTALGQEKFWREPPTNPAYLEARRREVVEYRKEQLHRDLSDLTYYKGGLQETLEENVLIDPHRVRQAVEYMEDLIQQKWEDITHIEETEEPNDDESL